MNWDDLRYLEAVSRTGSVGGAARELRISASTVYRRIGVLEASLGYPCLVRGMDPAVLTEAGQVLAQVARRTRTTLAEVAGSVRARETEIAGEVSLTTVEGLLPFLLDPIAKITARHPELRVVLRLADTGPSVRDREVDVAIGIMPRPPTGCWGRRIMRIPYGVFGTKEAAARKPEPRWVVRSEPLVHSPEAGWERAHAGDVAASSGSLNAVVALVGRGVGIGLLPRMIGEKNTKLIDLSKNYSAIAPLERVAWVLTHPDLRRTPRVVALMDVLTEELSARAPHRTGSI